MRDSEYPTILGGCFYYGMFILIRSDTLGSAVKRKYSHMMFVIALMYLKVML